jgi:prepilin signal peptidase PulO-like enzyme (type II secretory pathway)
MYPTISFACAAGFGLWAGGLMNLLSRRLAQPGTGESFTAIPARLVSALVLGLMVLSIDYSWEWLVALPFAAALVTISFCDFRYMIIPDIITLPGIVLVAVLRLWIQPLPYWDYVTAALFGSGFFYLVALMILVTTKREAIGGGDIKLLALTGLVLGIKLTILSFLMFCFIGTIAGLLIVFTERYRNDLIVPFGPFIAASSIISYFWGNGLISWAIGKLIL